MHAFVDVTTWLAALRVLAPALARTNPFRKAWCALSAAENRVRLRIASVDWDTEYALDATVRDPGEAFVDADVIRALPLGRLADAIECRTTGKTLVLRSGVISYTLALLTREQIPALPSDLVPTAEATGAALKRVLLLGAGAARRRSAAADNDGPEDCERDGAWVEIDRDRVTVMSTDRVRVARASTSATVTAATRVALPMHAALALGRAAAAAETAVLHRSKRTPSSIVSITAGPAIVRVRTLAAVPPDPSSVTLASHEAISTLRLEADRLADALRAALAIAGTDPVALAHLTGQRAHLTIRVSAGGNEATASMSVERASGADADVTVHARPLLGILAPLGHATVTLAVGSSGLVEISAADGQLTYQGVLAGAASPRTRSHEPIPVGSTSTTGR